MATTKVWTTEEVAQIPDDSFRYALIRGVLHRMAPPMARHGIVANTIGRLVGNFVAERELGAIFKPSSIRAASSSIAIPKSCSNPTSHYSGRMRFLASACRWSNSLLDPRPRPQFSSGCCAELFDCTW